MKQEQHTSIAILKGVLCSPPLLLAMSCPSVKLWKLNSQWWHNQECRALEGTIMSTVITIAVIINNIIYHGQKQGVRKPRDC
jgi:hypothetical protein